jgi:dTDP-4-dehydrorhamnose 3,5-epimerase
MVSGVLITPLRKIENPKGDIYHAMKLSSDGYVKFGEAYFSAIHRGVIKGWKRHLEATLNLVVIKGSIKFVIFDSSTQEFFEIILGPANYARLTVKPGLWVAFEGLGDGESMLLNISSLEHDPEEADNVELSKISYCWGGK